MKLFDPILEATVLKAICSLGTIDSGKILAHVSEYSFYSEEALEAYSFIKDDITSTGNIISWENLLTNPDLSESVRSFLKATKSKKVRAKDTNRLVEFISKYERLRRMFMSCDEIINDLSKDSVDIEELENKFLTVSSEITTSIVGVKEQVHVIGKGNNTRGLVERTLDNKKVRVVPTGFRGFDENNRGLPIGEAVLMAGKTGGGKTAIMAIQMLLNMSRYAPSIVVPLEMNDEQTMARILSNLSKIPIHRFTAGDLTEDEKRRINKAYTKFAKELKDLNTNYNIWCPDKDVSMTEVLYSLLPLPYEVYLIDYVGLLKGLSDDDQVKKLGNAVREAKIFAKTHNKLVIILAQLNEDNKVKYSRAMVEHVSNCWIWEYNEANKESGIITIVPIKSRNQDPTPFDLAVDFSIMRAGDASEADFNKSDKETKSKPGTAAAKAKDSRDRIGNLARDIDDYDLSEDDD